MKYRFNTHTRSYHIATSDGILCRKTAVLDRRNHQGRAVWDSQLVDHIPPLAHFCETCQRTDKALLEKEKKYGEALADIGFIFSTLINKLYPGTLFDRKEEAQPAFNEAAHELAKRLGFERGRL